MHHWITWTMVNIRCSLQPPHMCRGFIPRLGFIPSQPRLNWFSCFRVQMQFFNLVMSSFLYAHCIDAMLNAVLSFRYLLLPDRIRSRCEERVRDQDRQHRRSIQVHQRTSQGKRIFSFEHIWSRSFFKCFESPPNTICIRFNCLLSIDRVTYVDACLPFCCLYILIQCS